jgi:hypothetical protein
VQEQETHFSSDFAIFPGTDGRWAAATMHAEVIRRFVIFLPLPV